MIFAVAVDEFVDGQGQALALQPLLQTRLGVLAGALEFGDARREQPAHHLLAGVIAVVEIDGGDQRLERVGENRFATKAAAFQFARAQLQPVAQLKLAGDDGQCLAIDQLRAKPGPLAFAGVGMRVVQQFGDRRA